MQIEQYEEIINEQGYKLRNINNQLINERENFEQQKTDFQTIIKAQTAKMEELKQLLEKERKENTDLRKKQDDIDLMLKEYEEDKVQYTEQFARYQNDKIETQKKNLELQETIDKLRKESFEKEKQINDLVKNSEKLANQLNDMKSAIVNKQLTKKSFTVEMMGKGKKIIEIIFQKKQDSDSDKDEYEMSIINKSKNEIIEVINLLDISGFQINEKDKNRVDISYTVS